MTSDRHCSCPPFESECPKCMGKLREIARLYQKAFLEFLAKCEWIGTSRKPDCEACIFTHADRLGADIVREVFPKASPSLRRDLFEKLLGTIASKGVTDLRETYAAYQELTSFGLEGPAKNLNDLLKMLYSNEGEPL